MEKVSLRTVFVALFLTAILCLSSAYYIWASNGSTITIESGSFQSGYSYIVYKSGSTFYMRNGTNGNIDDSTTNDTTLFGWCMDNITSSGGSIFIKAASYSASFTLKDNVTLIVDTGATGLTVSIDSGATAWLFDYENDVTKYWSSGVLTFHLSGGDVLVSQSLNSTEWWSGSSNRTDLIVNPTDTASYIVETDGTYTWMTNCSTGQRDWTSMNASQIINWATGNLTNGGNIFVKAGRFNCSGGDINIDYADITIEGEGNATIFDWETTNCTGFDVNAGSFTLKNVQIKQGKFNTWGNDAINFASAGDHSVIDNVVFNDANHHAVSIYGADDVTVKNCYVNSSGSHGLCAYECYRPRFLFNTVRDVYDTQIEFYNQVYDGEMIGNTLIQVGSTVMDSIAVQGSSGCRVEANHCIDVRRIGIYLGNEGDETPQNCEHNMVIGNIIKAYSSGDRDAGICVENSESKDNMHNTISANIITGSFEHGIKLYRKDGSGEIYDITINANPIDGMQFTGIWMGNTRDSSCNANPISNVAKAIHLSYTVNSTVNANIASFSYDGGIYLAESHSNHVSDNNLHATASVNCIFLATNSDDNFIKDNMLQTGGTGLDISEATCNATKVDGNDFSLCTTDVSDSGTGTIWGSNFDQDGTYDQGIEP